MLPDSIISTKRWKKSAIASYILTVVGVLFATVTTPLSIMLIFQITDLQAIAQYSYSFRRIQYWLLAMGLLMFITGMFGILASMLTKRKFRILVLCMMMSTSLVLLLVFIVGMASKADTKKEFFENVWGNMEDDVRSAFQEKFFCCGFENYKEWNIGSTNPPSSCYASQSDNIRWPDPCHEKFTSVWLGKVSVSDLNGQTFGEERFNPMYFGFLCSFLVTIALQIVAVTLYFLALCDRANKMTEPSESAVTEVNMIRTPSVELTNLEADNANSRRVNVVSLPSIGRIAVTSTNAGDDELRRSTSEEFDHQPSYLKRFTDALSRAFGDAFFWLGYRVALHPKMTIIYSLILTGAFSAGILQRYQPGVDNVVSFLSEDNQMIANLYIVSSTFSINIRRQHILVVDNGNVLSKASFDTALSIDESVKKITSSTGDTFSSICVELTNGCRQRSLFELWSFDSTTLQGLTEAQILDGVNADPLRSPVFDEAIDIRHILGGISYGAPNTISSANAHLLQYLTRSRGGDWENLFVDIVRNGQYPEVDVYIEAQSSQTSENANRDQEELPKLFAGFALVFLYIIAMTGKMSLIEHRVYVALMGVTSAGLSMAAGIGFTPTFGLKWSVLHLIVPFLVIGIGVDDMFVLLQAWNTVNDDPKLKSKSLEEKAGHVLKSAGTSITITSVTDLVAFAVGASSEIGAFASFSVFVAICIILLFFLQCTFFMACVVLDERRKSERYDACLACCYKHGDSYKAGKFADLEIFPTIFEDGLGQIVTKLPVAVILILVTLGLSGLMSWGFYNLKVEYDPVWYLPSTSYLVDYWKAYDKYINTGADAAIYVIGADFYNDRAKLHTLFERVNASSNVDSTYITSWFEDFVSWLDSEKGISDPYSVSAFANEADFYAKTSEFLSTDGSNYEHDVAIQSGVISGARFNIRHRAVENEVENTDIVIELQDICDGVEFSSGVSFPYGRLYFLFEINRIIRDEVYRNLGITLGCVFLMILPILANIQMALWVGLCVLFTTIDVAGTMYFVGFSIETSTIITLLLSVGLAVDYAAHIGHSFLTLRGSRKLRARVSVGRVGLAVFNGGFSTFLALSLLAGSTNYSYKVFFTVFTSVIGFGLWNGLIFLPSLLSIIGPECHAHATDAILSSRHRKRKEKRNAKNSGVVETAVINVAFSSK